MTENLRDRVLVMLMHLYGLVSDVDSRVFIQKMIDEVADFPVEKWEK